MILCLDAVLDAKVLTETHASLDKAEYLEGAITAGWNARALKNNEQAVHEQAGRQIQAALQAHPVFMQSALPARMSMPIFSRYEKGMGYGRHVDDALMAATPPIRTDLAVTLFLSDPENYSGGELVLHTNEGRKAYKLKPGQALLYPASHLHSVETVLSGTRHAAILWVQSRVRDAAHREILFDLDAARRLVWTKENQQTSPAFDLLNKSYANLLRRWAES